MNRIIWTCWFAGREAAPRVVRDCVRSWEHQNPEWEVRCLDANSVSRYVPLTEHVNLARQSITAPSLSDLLRILLLHEFGGVWVDATALCNRPLDDWLPTVMTSGFFAFASPGGERPLASWFLSAEAGHPLVAGWCAAAVRYWARRRRAAEYFWFHRCFAELCARDAAAQAAWARVPRLSADPAHAVQRAFQTGRPAPGPPVTIDWSAPVFKLTHRVGPDGIAPGGQVDRLLIARSGTATNVASHPPAPPPPAATPGEQRPRTFASLKVSTVNLGDHIQILAAERLLRHRGVVPDRYVDRDDELQSAPSVAGEPGPVGIVLNGWFKNHRTEWPPHPSLAPVITGFHIRLRQCPELISEESLAYLRRHGPVGCRDPYTLSLLRSLDVEAYLSGCLSLSLPRRMLDPRRQRTVFVVSRDRRIERYIPAHLGPYRFVSHYSRSRDFARNLADATRLLDTYRTRARLVVTTLLHAALPAIAMGIPVVIFHPVNDVAGHASDLERFSALDGIVAVHSLDDVEHIDWSPEPVDVSRIKLDLLEQFDRLCHRWALAPAPVGPISPAPARVARA